MHKILLGTTNQSKVNMLKNILDGCNVGLYTLKDFDITVEPAEVGKTPEENAVIKALFYSQFYNNIICHDSGLYFEDIDMKDARQPGLKIRTPNNSSKRLNDDELLEYYINIIKGLGGKVRAHYIEGIAVYNNGEIKSFSETQEDFEDMSFYMVDTPSEKKHIGWPLDSISIDIKTNKYFTDTDNKDKNTQENIIIYNESYKNKLRNFLIKSLGI